MMDQSRLVLGAGGHANLGTGSRLSGELSVPGTVELPGRVEGRVDASEIVIEETGEVEGELHAAHITIKGRFEGRVAGGTVELHATAQVSGEIAYETLRIDSGAKIQAEFTRRTLGDSASPATSPPSAREG